MSLTLTWELFYLALIQMISGISHFINTILFFVEPNFLKSIAFSILILNVIQICDHSQKIGWKRTILVFYGIYCLVSFFPSDLAYLEYMTWYEMVLFIPYILVIFAGGIIKMTAFGKKFLNNYAIFGYYVLVTAMYIIFVPTSGLWYIFVPYAVVLFILANIGGAQVEAQ